MFRSMATSTPSGFALGLGCLLALVSCRGAPEPAPVAAVTPSLPMASLEEPSTEDIADVRGDIVLSLGPQEFQDYVSTRPGVQYVKLVVLRGALDTLEDDEVFFFDADVYPLHMEFTRQNLLANGERLSDVQRESWTEDGRRFIFANLSRYDDDPDGGVVLELFEQDRASPALIHELFEVVGPKVSLGSPLSFKPNSLEQAGLHDDLQALGVPMASNAALSGDRLFIVQHPGRPAVGRLRLVYDDDPVAVQSQVYGWDEIVVLRTIPNDISRVAGIITTEPTTPLSHVNLRARSWDVPNVMIRDIEARVYREGFDGQWMYLAVGDDGIPRLRPASEGEIAAADKARGHRPSFQVPRVDLSQVKRVDLRDLRAKDLPRVGAKAANLGEVMALQEAMAPEVVEAAMGWADGLGPGQMGPDLLKSVNPRAFRMGSEALGALKGPKLGRLMLGGASIPPGFALPFGAYQRFLDAEENVGISEKIHRALSDNAFRTDAKVRQVRLAEIRQAIMGGVIPPDIRGDVEGGLEALRPSSGVFVRSSTNSEDLPGFNGAGLYQSVGPIPRDEGVFQALKEVWASVWSQRAYEAREDYGIDHLGVYPGALIQTAVKPTIAGVLVTRDVFDKESAHRSYLNANPGAGRLVVEEGMRPEQIYIDRDTGDVHRVSLSAGARRPLLSDKQAQELTYVGALLEAHFAILGGGDSLPLDIEWVYQGGQLYIVQARPYL